MPQLLPHEACARQLVRELRRWRTPSPFVCVPAFMWGWSWGPSSCRSRQLRGGNRREGGKHRQRNRSCEHTAIAHTPSLLPHAGRCTRCQVSPPCCPPAAAARTDVDEPPVVFEALACPALGDLLLLLRSDLGGLPANLAGTSQRSVHLTYEAERGWRGAGMRCVQPASSSTDGTTHAAPPPASKRCTAHARTHPWHFLQAARRVAC